MSELYIHSLKIKQLYFGTVSSIFIIIIHIYLICCVYFARCIGALCQRPPMHTRWRLWFLANRAIKTGALPLAKLLDGGATGAAGQSGAGIDPVILLERAMFAAAVHKITQAAAAFGDGIRQGVAYGLHQADAAGETQSLGWLLRADARME